MIRKLAIAILASCLGAVPALADTGDPSGTWKGPWYIGMSSGMATMEIAADGAGTIALTNLDEFGDKPVALARQSFSGGVLAFSATGASGAILAMSLRLSADGRQLRGNGKHGGFGARMELQRAD
ncbi:MAG TPA: hypothetical protein VFV71_04970 [Burkholderiales bacterium]|nr:hypothetical protein [Burkholderiales bacterium]